MTDTPSIGGVEYPAGLAPSPTIEALRAAIEEAEWIPLNAVAVPKYESAQKRLLDAARAVITEWDSHVATVKAMLDMPRPTPEEIRRIYVTDTATEVFGTSE